LIVMELAADAENMAVLIDGDFDGPILVALMHG